MEYTLLLHPEELSSKELVYCLEENNKHIKEWEADYKQHTAMAINCQQSGKNVNLLCERNIARASDMLNVLNKHKNDMERALYNKYF